MARDRPEAMNEISEIKTVELKRPEVKQLQRKTAKLNQNLKM